MDDQSNGLLKSFIDKIFRNKEDFLEKVIAAAGADKELRADETRMLLNILHLGRRAVREIMVPRTDIICADLDHSASELCQLIIKHGHSRIPIYQNSRDNITGIIHAKDMLGLLVQENVTTAAITQVMREPLFIAEDKNVIDMLQIFRSSANHLAIAVDEYGGTSGLVTLEDVLEEIVGEIEDEYDEPRPADIRRVSEGVSLVAGRTDLDDLDEHLGINLKSEQVETLNGYLCEAAGRVPVRGEEFTINGYLFRVRDADAKQIHWVHISFVPDSDH